MQEICTYEKIALFKVNVGLSISSPLKIPVTRGSAGPLGVSTITNGYSVVQDSRRRMMRDRPFISNVAKDFFITHLSQSYLTPIAVSQQILKCVKTCAEQTPSKRYASNRSTHSSLLARRPHSMHAFRVRRMQAVEVSKPSFSNAIYFWSRV